MSSRAAVDQDVAVDDELARLAPGRGEAEAEDDVVEPALEHLQQRLAGGRLVVAPRLVDQRAASASRGSRRRFSVSGTRAAAGRRRWGRGGGAAPCWPGGAAPAALQRGLAAQLPLALEVERDALAPLQLLHRSRCIWPIRAP